MKIQRAREESDFTILGNGFIDDANLSVLAVGLGTILLRMPPDASITLKAIAARRPEGLKALRRAANELEEAGYLIRVIERGNGGRLVTTTVMYSRPVPEDERPSSLAKPWSRAKAPEDVSAGRTESPSPNFGQGNFGEPDFGDVHSLDKDVRDKDGEEEDARVREGSSKSGPEWGAVGRHGVGVSLESVETVRSVAAVALRAGVELDPTDHQELAAKLDQARPHVEAAGLSWGEFEAYLHQGWWRGQQPLTRDVVAVLGTRMSERHIRSRIAPWAAKRRADAASAADPTPAPDTGADPFAGTLPVSATCPVHRTMYSSDNRCAQCEADVPPAPRRAPAATGDVEEPTPEVIAAITSEWAARDEQALQE